MKFYFKNDEKLREFWLVKGTKKNSSNALNTSLYHSNEVFFKFAFDKLFCKIFFFKDFKCDIYFLQHLVTNSPHSMVKVVLTHLQASLSLKIFIHFLNKSYELKRKTYSFIHNAIGRSDVREFAFGIIKKIYNMQELKELCGKLIRDSDLWFIEDS
mgnify:CR=1 FL=1